jgi:hypothetical protein
MMGNKIKLIFAGIALAASTVLSSAVLAETPQTEQTDKSVGGASALRVVKDKETGELRAATAQEAAAMRKEEQQAQKLIKKKGKVDPDMGKIKYNDDGSMSVLLDPSNLETIKATVNADGTITMRHGDHVVPAAKAKLAEK